MASQMAVSAMTTTLTEAVTEMRNGVKAANYNRKKREKKVTRSRIQREQLEKKDRANERETEKRRSEEIRKADKKEAQRIRKKDKTEEDKRNKAVQKDIQDRFNESNKRQLEQTKYTEVILAGLVDFIKTSSATTMATAEKEKEEKEEREKSYREEKREFAKILSNIVQKQNDTNQTIPHRINSNGTFAVNISTITTNLSQQIIVSSRPLIYTPRR